MLALAAVSARCQAAFDPTVRTNPRSVRGARSGQQKYLGAGRPPVLHGHPWSTSKSGHKIWACSARRSRPWSLAFLVVVPYAHSRHPTFLNGLAFDARHYAEGHIGNDGGPGLPQLLFYGRHFISDLGVGAVVLAVVGATAYCAADWRRAAHPRQLSHRADVAAGGSSGAFPRNVLNLYPVVAMFLVYGIACRARLDVGAGRATRMEHAEDRAAASARIRACCWP